ncbi:hypothetical protein B296_00029542 [Ensete ventricosum]|uniref:Uncharacterized protein n=1 Tax=Ensete ventricosum TaxID=4639 RepID=A0A426ZBF8_ENSVE|nr:hypothetical protein B296_00029542 [Ensete ventricosum]
MVAVKPRKGDAVLFFSLHINGTTDPASLHGSCPVIEGEKWSAPKWIHVRSFDNPQRRRRTSTSGGDCSDASEFCAQWAAAGECHKNPLYMIGNNGTTGNCRRSCNVIQASDGSVAPLISLCATVAETWCKLQTTLANHSRTPLIGHNLSDDEIVVHTLNGLGVEYKELVAAIRARDPSLSFEELYDKLTDYETHLKREDRALGPPIIA